MNRRRFLGGALSAGVASTLLPGATPYAQAGEIRIGMSAAFRGAHIAQTGRLLHTVTSWTNFFLKDRP